ncbi:hypothetical protein OPT61_g4807 [Boeremia exigua]|uniref:Uncharacterized protein n=1 Tax=Boeremia exigua TaxID=749465 RepID=A0ACC2ICL6_9PLEO|nr:hypothetical protein OPT61_g4807 [Boeremia exigua]
MDRAEYLRMDEAEYLLLICCKCDTEYVGVSTLLEHLLEDHQGREIVRTICVDCLFESSTWRPEWVQHLRETHGLGEKPLPCPAPRCRNTRFESLRKLSGHYRNCHNSRCNHCEIRLESADALRAHKTDCVQGRAGHDATPFDSQSHQPVADAQFEAVDLQRNQPDLEDLSTGTRTHVPPADGTHIRATVRQPVAVPRAPSGICRSALAIIMSSSPQDQKAAELLAKMQGRGLEGGPRATRDAMEQPNVLRSNGSIATSERGHFISCTTRELEKCLDLFRPKVDQCWTVRIRDCDWIERGSTPFLRWINSGGRFEVKLTSRSGVRKPHLLFPDGFLARFDARKNPKGPHGSASLEDCLSIETSGRALQDVTVLPEALSLLDCDLLHLLERRIPDEDYLSSDRLATADLEDATALIQAAIDPGIRTVSYRERGSFEPWHAESMAGFWAQNVEGWTVYFRYTGPVTEETLAALAAHRGLNVFRKDNVEITYVGPGDVLIMRPEMSQSKVSQPVIYCSFTLEDTLAIRSPVWPNEPDELLKTLHHVNDLQMNKGVRFELYLFALKNYVIERGNASNHDDEHQDGHLSKHMRQVLKCPRFSEDAKRGILSIIASVMPRH